MKHLIGATICTIAVTMLAACGPQDTLGENSDPALGVQDLNIQMVPAGTPTPTHGVTVR